MMSEPTTVELVSGAWTARIIFPICILICISFIKTDLKNKSIPEDQYQIWLDRLSLLTMLCCTFQMLVNFLHKTPWICQYNFRFIILFWGSAQCIIPLYQTVRLQSIFSAKRVHNKYGYNKCVFIIVYTIIFVNIAVLLAVFWSILDVKDHGVFGCEYNSRRRLKAYNISTSLIVYWFIFGFGIMHLGVLSLYVIKILQIKRKIRGKSSSNDQSITNKVNFFLSKIVTLTLLYYLKAMMALSVYYVFSIIMPFAASPVLTIAIGVDMTLSVYLVYLMIERNNYDYTRFVKCFRLRNLCCCLHTNWHLKGTAASASEMDDVVQIDTQPPRDRKGTETTKDNEVELELKEYQDASVMTQTVIEV